MKYRAIDILTIAYNTFRLAGDDSYAKNKTNIFLKRCGAILEDGPDQLLSLEAISEVAY